jgi:hypothetical protein
MIYLDSSVALAYLLAEDRFPLIRFGKSHWWPASRMRGLESDQRAPIAKFKREAARNLIGRAAMIENGGTCAHPGPATISGSVRTLGAIHLAAFEFIRARKQNVQLANYDEGLVVAAWLSWNCSVVRGKSTEDRS